MKTKPDRVIHKDGEKQGCTEKVTHPSGATRSIIDRERYDLITPYGLRRLALTCGEGAEIHGERNWEKGLPHDDTLNRVERHINLYKMGDASEDHLAHAAWGLFALMHFEELEIETHIRSAERAKEDGE